MEFEQLIVYMILLGTTDKSSIESRRAIKKGERESSWIACIA